ncbi:CSS motif domain associated with EAL [compost metagenome]
MTYDKTERRLRLRNLIVAVLVGLSPVAAGLLVIKAHLYLKLESDALNAAHQGLALIEKAIGEVAAENNALMSIAGKDCLSVLPILREKAITLENLRSLLLLTNNTAYCNSLLGEADVPINPGNFFNRTLWLSAGNEITPERAILYYRTYKHPHGVISLIEGNTLQTKLATIKSDASLTLEIGQAFLQSNGHVGANKGPEHEEFHSRVESQLYGFAVHGGFPDGMHGQQFKRHVITASNGLLLVGLLTGGVVYGLMRSPPRAMLART